MIQVSVIGSGNVAHHLLKAFGASSEVEVVQVFARNKTSVEITNPKIEVIEDWSLLKNVDLIIIAVTDDAIANVSEQIPLNRQLVVHTSGSVALDALNDKNRRGVFYPLQTFSKAKAIDYRSVPICIEAETSGDFQILETLAKSITDYTYSVNSQQRQALHVAAVFVCNFTNHLYQIGAEICNENKLPFEILKPLIQETAQKIITLSPEDAQTGPAKRKDTQTINKHLAFLTEENQKEIYKLLTKSIIDHGKKL
ncbi:MAG: Rossmann-like and DUF2520 domain-containing protein [Flavobacterium sp.]